MRLLINTLNDPMTSPMTSRISLVTDRKAGLLLSSVEEMTDSKSVAMLAGRLLMSTLFLFVGWSEVVRQWNSVWSDAEGHVYVSDRFTNSNSTTSRNTCVIYWHVCKFSLSCFFLGGGSLTFGLDLP